MAELFTSVKGLTVTNSRIDGLMADFSGLNNLEKIVDKVLRRLQLNDRVNAYVSDVKRGNLSMADFDGWFSEIVRIELGKTLGIVRNKAIAKARAAGAGSASTAMLRRTYRNEYRVALHDLGNRKRLSSRDRVVPDPDGGESGIRRRRTVSPRTQQLRKYYGPDRAFILRFLDGGTDVRTAKSSGPTGNRSMSTWGARGNIAPRNIFHSLGSDMELAAQQLGETLIGKVEKWVEQAFTERTE